MNRVYRPLLMVVLSAGIVTASTIAAQASPITFSASGSNSAAIQTTVDNFRAALGANNGVGGSFSGGRREINWDGVPDNRSSPNDFPADFFNVNSPRGVIFSAPGGATFQVSSNTASGVPVRFGNIDASYTNIFQTFSAQRLFTSVGTNVYDVSFFVPGTSTPALVSAFGSVFTDVDLDATTTISYFDANDNLLGTFAAPTANNGLSFLGVQFTGVNEGISRVRVTGGNAPVAAGNTDGFFDGIGVRDIVVEDDFIYSEPVARISATAVPEAGTGVLAALPLLALAGTVALRRRSAAGV